MSEIRTFISSGSNEPLTAGVLKAYLEHVPDAAVMTDGSDADLTMVKASWEVTPS